MHSFRAASLAAVPAVVTLGVLAVLARADVDIEILTADKVQGSLSVPEQVETYRLTCPQGASLSIAAKGKKGLAPQVRVFAPDDSEPFAADIVSGGSSARLKVSALHASGQYRVELRAAGGSGDYKLNAAWKTPKKVSAEVTLGAGEELVPFSVGAGSRVKVKAKASKGSAAVPVLVRIEGPDDYVLPIAPTKSASDAFASDELPADGDYVLVLRDGGAEGGNVGVSIGIKQPKPARRNVDLRDSVIGSSEGAKEVVSAIVRTAGGTVVGPAIDSGSPIGGSSVIVPSGALSTPAPIVIATAPDLDPKGRDVGTGPTVYFGPEGLRFAEDATVTIPFDAEAYGGDVSMLVVYTRDARGKVSLVAGPYDVDPDAGTCTFQTSHFSSFRTARRITGQFDNSRFVGAWQQVAGLDPGEIAFLVIGEDGAVDYFDRAPDDPNCYFFRIVGPGLPLEFVFTLTDGVLRPIDDSGGLEFTATDPADVPTDCLDPFQQLPGKRR